MIRYIIALLFVAGAIPRVFASTSDLELKGSTLRPLHQVRSDIESSLHRLRSFGHDAHNDDSTSIHSALIQQHSTLEQDEDDASNNNDDDIDDIDDEKITNQVDNKNSTGNSNESQPILKSNDEPTLLHNQIAELKHEIEQQQHELETAIEGQHELRPQHIEVISPSQSSYEFSWYMFIMMVFCFFFVISYFWNRYMSYIRPVINFIEGTLETTVRFVATPIKNSVWFVGHFIVYPFKDRLASSSERIDHFFHPWKITTV